VLMLLMSFLSILLFSLFLGQPSSKSSSIYWISIAWRMES
jgi:hypothetical protein